MAAKPMTRRSTLERLLRPQISSKHRSLNGEAKDSQSPASLPEIRADDIVIAVMGVTGVGKSRFISHFSSTAVVGTGVKSCTATISVHSAFLEGRKIYLIDTPGFDDTTRTDTEILHEIAGWLKKSYEDKVQLAGIVYLHYISDNRVVGSSATNIRLFKELCGEKALSCVVLATTMWDLVPREKAERREQELLQKEQFWGGLIQHGCRAMRQDDGSVSATRIIRHILDQKSPQSLQLQDEIANGTPLIETRVGKVLEEKIDAQAREFNEVIKKLEEEIERLKAEKAERDKREEDQERARLNRQAQEENREKQERAEKEAEKLEKEAQEKKRQERQEMQDREAQENERRNKEIEDRLNRLEEQSASVKERSERNEKERETLKKPWWSCTVM